MTFQVIDVTPMRQTFDLRHRSRDAPDARIYELSQVPLSEQPLLKFIKVHYIYIGYSYIYIFFTHEV